MSVEALPEYLKRKWPEIRESLRSGTYEPQPGRRAEIPKPGGGVRKLGIPTVLDRFIQQALLQVLQPNWDRTFSERSYGFRPGRSAQQAVAQAQRYLGMGCSWVVDLDLEKFFDRVNHDKLMSRVRERVSDRRVLKLMDRYLKAGALTAEGFEATPEGTPQGGPLSPLLANLLLDGLDKELENRGHFRFRYSGKAEELIPRAKKGALDLSTWNFKKSGPVALNGEWEFYWKADMRPGNTATAYSPREKRYISVPGIWNGFPSDGGPISGKGFATYRLKISVNPQETGLAFRFIDIATAFTAYVNGRRILSVGDPGQTAATTIPRFHPQVVNLPLLSPEIDLIIFVSNFDHYKGGIWEEIVLGNPEEVQEFRERKLVFSLFLFGAILMMGFYHLGLFLNYKSDRSSLYCGLFCLVICIRILTTGERYLIQVFPDFPWAVLIKLSYLSFYIVVPLFALYVKSIFSQEVGDKILFPILLVGAAFSALVLFAPTPWYTRTVQLYEGFTILAFLCGFYVIMRARRRKRQGALIFLFGYGILFLTAVNDVLYANLIIVTTYLLPLGLFFFMFSQVFLLSLRFGKAFQTIETQREELLTTNAAYRNEIQERKRTQDLLRQSNADLEIRVKERTSDLASINQELMLEIEERRKSEQALRGSERQRRALSFQILSAQENERKIIDQDLHDGIASNLAAIKIMVKRIGSKEAKSPEDFPGILNVIQQTIDDLRRIMRNLRPAILDDLGILASIRWFIDEFRKIHPEIQIQEQIRVQEREVPERLKIEILRILQEATNNAVKHSGAGEVRISLVSNFDQLEVSVEDNGKGFNAQEIHAGLGLKSMRERVELSGGSFSLETAIGQGAKIIASWPRENSRGT